MSKFNFSVGLTLIIFAVCILFSVTLPAYIIDGSTVTLVASDRTSDNTSLIQGFLNNANYNKIIIQPGTNNASWPVGPLYFNHNNTEIHLNTNTVLEALTGGYPDGNHCVLKAISLSNIKVTGDNGSEILMHKAEYANLSAAEWRHALSFLSCSNVTVSGLTLANAGGDGIFIGGATETGYCSSVTITNVVTDGCARNGVSVISVNGLTITGCTFKNSQGMGNAAAGGPWAGIDLEPDCSTHQLVNIVIDNCSFLNNGRDGFDIYAPQLSGSAGILNITVQNCTMQGNGLYGIVVARIPASLSDSSSIVFQNCTISNNNNMGIWIGSKAKDAGTLSFTDCFLTNNNLVGANTPFLINYFYSIDGAEVGGNIQLNNVVVEQPTNRTVSNFLSIDGTYGSIDNVSGTIRAFGGTLSTANTTNINVIHLGIAANKTSSASSIFDTTCPASEANDGVYSLNNPDNCWACGNNQDIGAWWSVDLGKTLALGKVRLQYRKIGGNYHFVPLSVTVQTSSDNSNWITVVNKSANVPQEGTAYSNILYEYPIGRNARYVRLLFEDGGSTFSGYKLIELAEVEIIPQGPAANKTSVSSSSFDSSCPASEANDGVYFQNDPYNGNFWACGNGQDIGAWWSVDLGQTLALGKVRIQYMTIGGNYHFVPLSVTVQTSNDNSNWTTVVSKSTNVPQEGAQGSEALYEYFIGGNARYVRLLFEDGGSAFSGYKLIELTEVEITPPELAANKTSFASSISDSTLSAFKANDGVYSQNNPDNCWACGNNQDIGAWWSVDLGESLGLDKVRVQYRNISGNYHLVPLSVTVQVSSDNSNWTTVVSKSANVPQEGTAYSNILYEYPIVGNAHFVRLLFEDGGSTFSGYKLIELAEVEIIPY